MLSTFLIVSLAFILVFVLTLVSYLISETYTMGSSREEFSSYECGFEHHSLSRLPLSLRYFMLTLVFLVFDMEVMLLLFIPSSIVYGFASYLVYFSLFAFVGVLMLGLVYEWVDGSLDWVM